MRLAPRETPTPSQATVTGRSSGRLQTRLVGRRSLVLPLLPVQLLRTSRASSGTKRTCRLAKREAP